jgi:hypothetical protein
LCESSALRRRRKGNKHLLGLREGPTESTRVVRSLLSDLVERGLDADRARLWVIDGGKALRRAIVDCFGGTALVQRCQEHKRRTSGTTPPAAVTPQDEAIWVALRAACVWQRTDNRLLWQQSACR